MEFALFTKFMRGLSIEEVGRKTKALGFSYIEFPVRGEFECNLENVSVTLPAVADELRSAGVKIAIVASDLKEASQKEANYLYEASREAGAKYIRPGYWEVKGLNYWETYDWVIRQIKGLEKLSERHGVKTVIHIHSGKLLTPHCLATYLLVKECDPRYVGVYYDPAHLALDGEDYELGLGIILDHLSLVAVKNCCYVKQDDSSGQWQRLWVSLREGLVPWPRVLSLLQGIGYDGFLCLHAEYSDGSRVEKLVADDFGYLQSLLQTQI